MILHVTFSDGSNPWVSLPGDRQTIAKHWRKWIKYHPDTAQPVAIVCRPIGSLMCYPAPYRSGYIVRDPNSKGNQHRYYKYLGHALAALERLGGCDQ